MKKMGKAGCKSGASKMAMAAGTAKPMMPKPASKGGMKTTARSGYSGKSRK